LPPRFQPPKPNVELDSRLATFQTSPHGTHRQYVSDVTVLLVVVRSEAPQTGQAAGGLMVCVSSGTDPE
jgi:hypothetical protein